MLVAIDDSQMHKSGVFVYSHALVYDSDRVPDSLVIIGSSPAIYTPSPFIADFVRACLPQDFVLLACSHYYSHHNIWPLVSASSLDSLSKNEHRLLSSAHHEARRVARDSLESFLKADILL